MNIILFILLIAIVTVYFPKTVILLAMIAILMSPCKQDNLENVEESEYKKILGDINKKEYYSADDQLSHTQLTNGNRNKLSTDSRHHWSKAFMDNYETPKHIWWGDDEEETSTRHSMSF